MRGAADMTQGAAELSYGSRRYKLVYEQATVTACRLMYSSLRAWTMAAPRQQLLVSTSRRGGQLWPRPVSPIIRRQQPPPVSIQMSGYRGRMTLVIAPARMAPNSSICFQV